MDSCYDEKALYFQLIKRMDERGELKSGAREGIETALRQAMEAQGPY